MIGVIIWYNCPISLSQPPLIKDLSLHLLFYIFHHDKVFASRCFRYKLNIVIHSKQNCNILTILCNILLKIQVVISCHVGTAMLCHILLDRYVICWNSHDVSYLVGTAMVCHILLKLPCYL